MNSKILIVDDSKATRRVLSALVNSRWTVCGEAENGRAGVRKFRELKPDLVLLDLAMPDIDGIEAARQMHAVNPSVPLILFTLLDPWGLESAARKAGILRIVSKSEGGELMASIEDVFARRERSTPQRSESNKVRRAARKQKAKSALSVDAREGETNGKNSNCGRA
jgi:two-component system, chemotaxis family, chemotaxis protein CheY